MKKRTGYLLISMFLFLGISCPPSANAVLSDSYNIENKTVPESINYILGTSVGINMLNFIENKGASVDLDNGKTVTLPNAEATLFKGSKKDGVAYDLLWISLADKGSFLFGVETSISLLNPANSYMKLYTASGKAVLIQNNEINILNNNYSFQDKDDAANAVPVEDVIHSTVDTCTILLILGILTGGLLLIAWIIVCLL